MPRTCDRCILRSFPFYSVSKTLQEVRGRMRCIFATRGSRNWKGILAAVIYRTRVAVKVPLSLNRTQLPRGWRPVLALDALMSPSHKLAIEKLTGSNEQPAGHRDDNVHETLRVFSHGVSPCQKTVTAWPPVTWIPATSPPQGPNQYYINLPKINSRGSLF